MPRVLIVDDDPVVRAVARDALVADGWTVDEAGTAREAMDVKGPHDALVLDFVLPDADGVQLLLALRGRGVVAPAIALTSATNEEVARRFLDAGASDFVSKTDLTPLRLTRTLRRVVDAGVTNVSLDGAAATPPRPTRDWTPQPSRRPATRGEVHVLVIDDTEVVRAKLRDALGGHGWTCEEAATGAQALRLAEQGRFDVVLLDHLLPDTDGLRLMTKLRQAGIDAPIVALTGHGDEALAMRFLTQGASDYLTKDTLSELRLGHTIREVIWLTRAARP